MAGHSKWANIQHRKGRQDAARSKLFSKLSKEITVAVKMGGGTTDLLGCFVYSNRGWDESIPAFVIEDSTANLCGLNERNFNGEPCNFWFREIVAGQQRSRQERAWVYLSADRVR